MQKLQLPNVRKMFRPSPGYVLFEVDLKGADARTVAWEAGDQPLKDAFRTGVDIHAFNAETMWPTGAPLEDYTALRPDGGYRYPILARNRGRMKIAVHAVNYFCKERTLAEHIGSTVPEAKKFIDTWFFHHPGIPAWHRRTDTAIRTSRKVTNVYGNRRLYFDRADGLLPEALAWIGQSTTAVAINKLIAKLNAAFNEFDLISGAPIREDVEILLQTHDSVTFQVRETWLQDNTDALMAILSSHSAPYPDPMPLPCDVSCSRLSWGELQKFKP